VAALSNLDAVKALVETAESSEAAQASLMELLDIDQSQARAVMDLQLRAMSPQRRQQFSAEHDQIVLQLAGLESMLASPDRLREVVGTERGANLASMTNAGGPGPSMATGRARLSAARQVAVPDGIHRRAAQCGAARRPGAAPAAQRCRSARPIGTFVQAGTSTSQLA
jgi:hypothetical protein